MIFGAIVLAASIHATCAKPNVPASVVKPAVPEYPLGASPRGDVIVRVTVAANGDPVATSIVRSSGDAAVDRSAVRAARASTYSPKNAKCVAVTGTYFFRVSMHPAP